MKLRTENAGMSSGMILLFAVAVGVAVGNLYWAQPLLANIAAALNISQSAAGILITVTQLGYASGVFFLVPLGDALNRNRLIPVVMAAASIALFGCGVAPGYALLMLSLTAVGFLTISGQLLIPLAGDLATDNQRGHVIGSVTSGGLTGILLSRTVSGMLGDAMGWRSIYFLAGAVTLLLSIILALRLPRERKTKAVGYGSLLLSIFTTVRIHRSVQITLVLGACCFSVFTMFWTSLTFLLSAAPYSYSTTQIGLIGFVGLAGALAARRAGKLHDKGWSVAATGAGLLLGIISLVIAGVSNGSIYLLLLAILLIDIAIQGINVLNSTRLFTIVPEARSRLNSAFVVSCFLGGSVGSMLAGILWQAGGWYLVTAGELILMAVALMFWIFNRSVLKVKQPVK